MPYMEWSDKLSVGIASIDAQHKKLVEMANGLFDAMKAGHGKEVLGKTLDGLVSYTVTHFNYEEQLFAKTSYPGAAGHKQEHEALKKQVQAIQEKMKLGVSFAQSMEVMEFLKNWLLNHILGSDKAYSPHLAAKGIR
ncbi:MAG: bacteriohemerythrin [Rhodomicrobium sp.]